MVMCLSFIICHLSFSVAYATSVKSPNGNIVLTFNVENGCPMYSMTYKGKAVVKPSRLGLELAKDKHASMGLQEHDLMDGFTLVDEQTSEFNEPWQPVWGESSTIQNHYVEYAAVLQQQWEEVVKPVAHHR
mgnify:FL=1